MDGQDKFSLPKEEESKKVSDGECESTMESMSTPSCNDEREILSAQEEFAWSGERRRKRERREER